MIKTPILLNFTSFSDPDFRKQDPIDLFLQETDTTILNSSYILAPRYYIKIFPPANMTSAYTKVPIHRDSTSMLFEKIRLALSPSRGYGKVSSYRVEYWRFFPLLNLPEAKIKEELIGEEWWFIPTVNECNYTLQFSFNTKNYDYHERNIINTNKNISVTRELLPNNEVRDTWTDPEHVDIFELLDGSTVTSTITTRPFLFSPEANSISVINPVLTSLSLTRNQDLVTGDLIDGVVETSIDYLRPLSREEILFEDSVDDAIFFPHSEYVLGPNY